MIEKLVSGGQTGADSCIIGVGRCLEIPVGGLVPRGWRTERGPMPELAQLGFTESDSADYPVRTRQNVERSDATLVLATSPDSDGTRLTIRHAERLGRPFLLVDPFADDAARQIRSWLVSTKPGVLNVAGNRESKAPGIEARAEQVLYEALTGPS